ncbi:MAG: heme ABC transporter permease CcmB [SAR202 cluster bacterium Io17-Chloro-G9]|nr:MAG: heme ABC transporter permease CcmB [SAR202 cluster bacterium Io17-Chloro-G9]
MTNLLQPILVLLWKDILLEFRSREMIVSVVVFGLLVVVIFNFALSAAAGQVTTLAPGILWVAYAFAGTLAMNRSFVREQEQGGLEGLLLSPVSRDAIFLGKAMGSFLFMLVVEAVLLPVFAAFLGFSLLSFTLAATIFLATLGFAVVGTLFSAIAVQTRSRELMLPVLFFPVILPVIIGAVQATTVAIGGNTLVGLDRWLPLLAVFDALFLVICPWVFSVVVEE